MFPSLIPSVSIFDGCTDSCGWIAALLAAITYGTYGVPIKETKKMVPNLHPLVFQSYKTITMFVGCWLVLLMGIDVQFTYWGIVSGLLWVLGGTGGIVAIRYAGMAIAVGTWASVMICVNFVWGILIFQEPVENYSGTLSSFLLLTIGLIGMSKYSEQQQQHQQQPKKSSKQQPDHYHHVARSTSSSSLLEEQEPIVLYSKFQHQDTTTTCLEESEEEEEEPSFDDEEEEEEKSSYIDQMKRILLWKTKKQQQRSEDSDNDNKSNNNSTIVSYDEESFVAATCMSNYGSVIVDTNSDTLHLVNSTRTIQTIESEHSTNNHHQDVERQEEYASTKIGNNNNNNNYKNGTTSSIGGYILKNRTIGIIGAIINGIMTGTSFIPVHYAKQNGFGGAHYMISYAVGAFISNIVLWVIYILFSFYYYSNNNNNIDSLNNTKIDFKTRIRNTYNSLPKLYFKQLWFPGFMAGLLLTAGMFGTLISVTYLGQGVGNSVIQAKILISGMWGIFYYKEINQRENIRKWFLSAFFTVAGIVWLSHERLAAAKTTNATHHDFTAHGHRRVLIEMISHTGILFE